jgi:predicted nucleotidyltransferase
MNSIHHKQVGEMLEIVVKELKRGLQKIYGAQLKGFYLYGSCARDDADTASDVDILIILGKIESYSEEISRTSELVSELSLKYDKMIKHAKEFLITAQSFSKT